MLPIRSVCQFENPNEQEIILRIIPPITATLMPQTQGLFMAEYNLSLRLFVAAPVVVSGGSFVTNGRSPWIPSDCSASTMISRDPLHKASLGLAADTVVGLPIRRNMLFIPIAAGSPFSVHRTNISRASTS